jgi:hypothetical protein
MFALLGVLTSLGAPAPARATPEVQALLLRADAWRLNEGASQVETTVEQRKAGKVDKERSYLVLLREGRRSLVLFRTPIEKGQRMLLLGDDFWLVLPTSQRPLRITPAQKLLGDASAGDLATMSWAGDYDGTLAGEATVDGVPCTRLELASQRKGTSYTRIVLSLAKGDAHPVAADLYLASEKLAKRARFEMGELSGRRQVTAMTLVDELQQNRETVIRYRSSVPRSAPDEWFNPMFLARAELLE